MSDVAEAPEATITETVTVNGIEYTWDEWSEIGTLDELRERLRQDEITAGFADYRRTITDLIESSMADDEDDEHETAKHNLVGIMFVSADEVQPRNQRWMWEGRIPVALPTLLVGMQGLGKSQLTCFLAAQVSTGVMGSGGGSVLILSAEDDPETTILPRLIAAGADLSRVMIHKVDRSLAFPKDIELLDKAVERYGASFVVVDPIMAYLDAETDAYRPQDVRRTLKHINAICQTRRVTILPLMHFRKESANEVLHMVTSSSAFTEAPRSVLGLGKQPDTSPGNLALVHLKCNVGPELPTLAVTIMPTVLQGQGQDGEDIKTSFAKVGEEIPLTKQDVFQPKQGRPTTVGLDAMNFLRGMVIKYNGRVPVVKAKKDWKDSGGGSEQTLRRARDEMGLIPDQDEATGAWYWIEIDAPPAATGTE